MSLLSVQEWESVVVSATAAPSIHNSQPWLFAVDGDRLEVRRDPARALPAIDRSGRQQTLSVGIAVHFSTVALAAFGCATEVAVAGAEDDDAPLATVTVTGRGSPAGDALTVAAAIAGRHTDRSPFVATVPAAAVARLVDSAGGPGLWVKVVAAEDDEVAAVAVLDEAEAHERRDEAYLAELAAWSGRPSGSADGVPADAVPGPGAVVSNWTVRDFSPAEPAARPVPGDDGPPVVERPLVMLLGTDSDDVAAWVAAGQALGRLWLQATVDGLALSPLTQALDQDWARRRLAALLGVSDGAPQMLVRIGVPASTEAPAAPSGRRPVSDVLRFAAP